ncbi:MAG TPA: hypothetical protein VM285_15900 [Polyangia bacterium]|nr:hypothetical protein [Polyangia bacterium]
MPRETTRREDGHELADLTAADHWPRGISRTGGFRLPGTPLCFPGCERPGLLFLGDMDQPAPRRGQRVLATPFTAAALGAKERGLDALHLGFGRKIRLGRMDIRLLPAGRGPGSALLEVGLLERRIVYCGGVRLGRPFLGPGAEAASCDLLLLDARVADPRPPSARRAGRQLADWAAASLTGGRPVIACGNLTAALEAARSLMDAGIPLRAFRPLYEMMCRLEGHDFPLAGLHRLEEELPDGEVVLHAAGLWPQTRAALTAGLSVAHAGPGRACPPWAAQTFRLGEGEDRPGLVTFVRETGAAEVALGPGCDDETASAIRKTGVRVHRPPRPTQIPLPL